MSEIGCWDYQLPSGVARDCWTTFSIGIFQWVPAKGKKKPKKGHVVIRIRGYTAQPGEAQVIAQAVVDRLNKFGIELADIQRHGLRRENGYRLVPTYWAHSETSCTSGEIAVFLINELVGAGKSRCPFCESPHTVSRDDGLQGICLQCGDGFFNNRKAGRLQHERYPLLHSDDQGAPEHTDQ